MLHLISRLPACGLELVSYRSTRKLWSSYRSTRGKSLMRKTVTSVDPTPLKSNGVHFLLKHVKWTLCKMIYKSLAGKNISNNRGASPVL